MNLGSFRTPGHLVGLIKSTSFISVQALKSLFSAQLPGEGCPQHLGGFPQWAFEEAGRVPGRPPPWTEVARMKPTFIFLSRLLRQGSLPPPTPVVCEHVSSSPDVPLMTSRSESCRKTRVE